MPKGGAMGQGASRRSWPRLSGATRRQAPPAGRTDGMHRVTRMLTASVASIAVFTLGSCSGPGSAGSGSRPSPVLASRAAAILRTMHCAPRLPASNGSFLAAPAPGIGPGPAVAVICEYQYRNGNLNAFDLTGQTMLAGQSADGLVAVLDSARPVQPDQGSCGGGPSERGSAVVIELGYLGGQRTSATVDIQTCEGSISALETAGKFFQLPWPVIDALLYRVADSSGNRGPRVPDLTGLSLAAAAVAARARGLVLSLSGIVVDQRAPLGSVVYQAVPAGNRSRLGNGPSVRVIVAVRSASACTAGQLRLTYRYNGASRGTEWGAVVISDTGEAPCRLPATAIITGLDQAGQPVAGPFTAAARNLRAPAEDATTAPLILGPLMAPI